MTAVKARIIGMGSYLPERILSNSDLEKLVDTSDDWIVSRTGIKERRIAAADEFPSQMGAAAARKALKMAGVEAGDLDLILFATMTPDYPSPSTAALVQRLLDAKKAAAVDIGAACTGFVYALSMAKAYVESGMYAHVLVIAAEKMSSLMDYTDRTTCVLFGDGAAAAVVAARGHGLQIDKVVQGADGCQAELVIVPGGGSRHPASNESVAARLHFFKMTGKEVYKHAIRAAVASARECLEAAGLTTDDVRWLIPHQANARMIEMIAKTLGIPLDRVMQTVEKYGNTSASGCAIALDEVVQKHPPKTGEHLLVVAFGGGLTWGSALLTQQGGPHD